MTSDLLNPSSNTNF